MDRISPSLPIKGDSKKAFLIAHAKSQEIETLINEESLLFAMYLRKEKEWIRRIVVSL